MAIPMIPSPNHYNGRPRGIKFVVIHTMETPEDEGRAKAVAANWFAKASSQVSAHYCVDDHEAYQCVDEGNQAWAAGSHGNLWGIHIEIAGTAGQSSSGWSDPYSHAAMEQAASVAAGACKRHNIPVRKITAAQLRQGATGIVGHDDCHVAWPQDTTHTDPGKYFPWTYFIDRVKYYMNPPKPKPAGIGGALTSAPGVCSWGPGRADSFVRGSDNALYHAWRVNGKWYGWERLGGVLTSDPAAATWGPNRIDVVARGSNGQCYHKVYDGAWHGWESLGGALVGAPAITSDSANHLTITVRGTDSRMYVKDWDGKAWSSWSAA